MRDEKMVMLLDVGNTNTHFCFSTRNRILGTKPYSAPSDVFFNKNFLKNTTEVMKNGDIHRVIACCVIPAKVPQLRRYARSLTKTDPLLVNHKLNLGIGIRYPQPQQIGADRLANAVGVAKLYRTPAIVVDFGTGLTFDVVNARSEYIGGVIAPGLEAMTDYLYQRTAMLPQIKLLEPRSVVGKSTVKAMQVGAVVGYRGLVKEILAALLREPGMRGATVVATGGGSKLVVRKVPAVKYVNPLLTLEGLRFIYLRNDDESG